MSSSLLTEYRCSCGKLLFKGFLCQCVVEVKCRRCGEVSVWGIAETLPYALVESGADAQVTNVSGDIENVLGHDRDYLIGRPISELFPLLRDAPPSAREEKFYDLKSAPLVLHDGSERAIQSCVIPRFQGGKFAGYRIFSVPKRS